MDIKKISTEDLIHKHILCHPDYDKSFCNKHRKDNWISINNIFEWAKNNEEDTFEDFLAILDEKKFYKYIEEQ